MLFEWAWAYFTWQRGSRVILEVPSEPPTAKASVVGLAVRVDSLTPEVAPAVRAAPAPATRLPV